LLVHPNEIVLTDYVDDALTAPERAEVERHLAACAACRALVDDQRDVRRVAGELDLREPPVRAWSRIARSIKLEADAREGAQHAPGAVRARSARGFKSAWVPWLAAAAALVLATYVGLRMRPATTSTSTASGGPSAAVSGPSAQAIEAELRAAEQHYENAITGLEQITKSEQSDLDPNTAATLQKNLAVIDQAISESRAALRAQPASEPAQQSLMDAFKTKIALLQDTVALINEMRKGNDAGGARIGSGLKQKG
jgi:anti-sigma factor RsiW